MVVKEEQTMNREIVSIHRATPTEDGAGVKLKRVFSSNLYHQTNPFVMLDEFGSDQSADYIGGFPPHPHRGFDTITYMLNGTMTHEDSTGNRGEISDYEVQWMRTGRGIIHSEMPAQKEGKMRGMQFWLNIPKEEKSHEPDYLDYPATALGTPNGNKLRLIAGCYGNHSTPYQPKATRIRLYHLTFEESNDEFIALPKGDTAMLYLLEGSLKIQEKTIQPTEMAILSTEGSKIHLHATLGSEVIIMSGHPISEPMVQRGPFVMNSEEEIQQAFSDYREGKF